MESKKAKVTVNIGGESYSIKGDINPDRIRKIALLLDNQMKKIASNNIQMPATKLAVLAGLNIAEELLKLQEDYDELIKLIEDEKYK